MYLIERSGRFYFNRRIPNDYRAYDPRNAIRVALMTDSRKTALRLAMAHNERLEAYWNALVHSGDKHSDQQYKATVDRCRTLGFAYYPLPTLAQAPIEQILVRLDHIEKHKFNEHYTQAILGAAPVPVIMQDDVLGRYWALSKETKLDKTPNQLRKWKNPRKRATRNFITWVGNKPLHELSRDDILRYRDWWIDRLQNDEAVSNTANKDLVFVKTIICTVAENLNLNLNLTHIFRKLLIKRDDSQKRLPFSSEYITKTLLNQDNLNGLNAQARYILYAFSESGTGLDELTGLLPEDIFLDAEIPYIHIRRRKGRSLKTKFRERKIALVGYALEAFKACPNGFTAYRDKPDYLSGTLSKYLPENKLFPSEQYTVYSLRHNFQDRLLAANAPDRVRADLMGHKFQRPAYGEGATLALKLEWLQKIQLKQG